MKTQLLLSLLLVACASDFSEELGQSEQTMTSWWSADSGGGLKYVAGVCMNATRDKCRPGYACPGNVACLVPNTKTYTYWLSGPDNPLVPEALLGSTSWKNEVRRVMGGAIPGELEWITDGVYQAEPAPSLGTANLIFQNLNCPCVTPGCANIPDLVCMFDPSPANLVTLTESFVGTYKRAVSPATVRTVGLDVVAAFSLYESHQIEADGLHSVLEHMARYGSFMATMGIGARTAATPAAEADNYVNDDMMNPQLTHTAGGSLPWPQNFENYPEQWETCLSVNLNMSGSSTYSYYQTQTPWGPYPDGNRLCSGTSQ